MVRSGRAFFPLFDSLRAIAALAIVAYHLRDYAGTAPWIRPYFERLDVGVTIFFLISGFLLYRPFVAAQFTGERRPASGPYAWKRFLRIVPAYWVALTVTGLWLSRHYVFGPDGLLYYGFGQIYKSETLIGGVGQAWTLDVELAFYALLPIWALIMWRIPARDPRERMRKQLVGLAVLALAGVIYQVALVLPSAGASSTDGWHFALPRYFDQFAVGMLLAVLSVWYQGRPKPRALHVINRFPGICVAVSLIAFWAVSTQLGIYHARAADHPELHELERHYLYTVVALGLLLPAVFGQAERGVVRRALGTRVLLWLGAVSYGIYLWHGLALERLGHWKVPTRLASDTGIPGWIVWTITGCAFTIVLAAVSYYVVERPALRLRSRPPTAEAAKSLGRGGRVLTVAAGAVLLAVAIAGTGYRTLDVAIAIGGGVALVAVIPAVRSRISRLTAPQYVVLGAGLFALAAVGVRLGIGAPAAAAGTGGDGQRLSVPAAYLAATYDGSALRLYVNGRPVASAPEPIPPPSSNAPLEIGSFDGLATWRGTIDEAALYGTAIPPSAIADHFRAGLQKQAGSADAYRRTVESTPGLISYWRLDDRGDVAADAMGRNPGHYRPGAAKHAGGIAASGDTAAATDGRHGLVIVPPAALGDGKRFTLEAWVLDAGTGNRHVFGRGNGYFLKTDTQDRWAAGFFTGSGAVVSVASKNKARQPVGSAPKPPVARGSEADASGSSAVAGLLAGLIVVLVAVSPLAERVRSRRRLAPSA